MNKMKAWQGSMAVSGYRGIISPAYYICSRIIGQDKSKLEKIVFISFLIQLGFYIITYISPSTKILIYSLLAQVRQALQVDTNIQT